MHEPNREKQCRQVGEDPGISGKKVIVKRTLSAEQVPGLSSGGRRSRRTTLE